MTGPGAYSTMCDTPSGTQCCRNVSYGDVCVVKALGLARYIIDPGEDCGRVYILFEAYTSSGAYIGEGSLTVHNYFGHGSRCKGLR